MRTSKKLFVIRRLTCNTKNITYTNRTQAIDLKASYTKSVKIFPGIQLSLMPFLYIGVGPRFNN